MSPHLTLKIPGCNGQAKILNIIDVNNYDKLAKEASQNKFKPKENCTGRLKV